jgi:hypothetical protein
MFPFASGSLELRIEDEVRGVHEGTSHRGIAREEAARLDVVGVGRGGKPRTSFGPTW